MYEYLDRPPQVGDIVQWIQNTDGRCFTKDKLYIVESLHTDEKENHPIVVRDNGTRNWAQADNFRIVKTKPAIEAKVGDTAICVGTGYLFKAVTNKLFTITKIMPNWCASNKTNIRTNPVIHGASTPCLDRFIVLCKQEENIVNPFKVGDKVRSISNDNPTYRPKDNIYTVSKIYGTDVYYKDEYAAHYSKFELVSEKEPDTTIKVGSHWERSYTSEHGKAGEIIQIKQNKDGYIQWGKRASLNTRVFLERFHPRPDLDNPKVLHQYWKDLYDQGVGLEWKIENVDWFLGNYQALTPSVIHYHKSIWEDPCYKFRIKPSTQETIQQSKPQEKGQSMTIQQLLQSLFGAEKPTTDYDRRPAILVVAYNRDGSQIGTAVADTLDDVKSKVADTPELWGCKVLTYTLDQEVSVDVPVKTTKAKVAKVKE